MIRKNNISSEISCIFSKIAMLGYHVESSKNVPLRRPRLWTCITFVWSCMNSSRLIYSKLRCFLIERHWYCIILQWILLNDRFSNKGLKYSWMSLFVDRYNMMAHVLSFLSIFASQADLGPSRWERPRDPFGVILISIRGASGAFFTQRPNFYIKFSKLSYYVKIRLKL